MINHLDFHKLCAVIFPGFLATMNTLSGNPLVNAGDPNFGGYCDQCSQGCEGRLYAVTASYPQFFLSDRLAAADADGITRHYICYGQKF